MSHDNPSFNWLTSSTVRLTATYLSIIMLMSIGFSIVFYNTSARQLNRQLPPRSLYSNYDSSSSVDFVPDVEDYLHDRINEGRHELIMRLFAVNMLALGAGGLLSFWLARRTLEPIEAAFEAQSQFVSDASHELRTPLTAIRASNEVALRKSKLTLSEAKEVIAQNTADVAKLQELSDALLQLVVSNGDDVLKLSPVVVQAAAGEAMNNIVSLAQAKNITVDDQLANLKVLADKRSLVQVLTTLLDNAIKYSKPDTTITLTSNQSGKSVLLHVQDQGVGILASDMPHIFQRFYRVDQSRNKVTHDGYGLGLAITHKLIKQQAGELTATSTPGEGSVFTIKLAAA